MRLERWTHVLEHPGPLASACVDVTKQTPDGQHEVELRWAARKEELGRLGAPDDLLEAVGRAMLAPTGRGGEHARMVVAAAGEAGAEILLDLVLPGRPPVETATWGPLPDLRPLVRAATRVPAHLLVQIDRAGADIEIHQVFDEAAREEEVEGGHDVLHKVPGGGWSHLRYQKRAEDSWERNATAVAEAVASLVRRHQPQVVLLAGDPRAKADFLEHAPLLVRDRTMELDTGGRAEGTSSEALADAARTALEEVRVREWTALWERFRQGEGRQQQSAQGLRAVVEALSRGQVEELVLRDEPTAETQVWVAGATHLGLSREDLSDSDTAPVSVPADLALVAAAAGSGAGVTLVYDEESALADGVGAVLRWSDPATVRDAAPSMPGHGEQPHVPGTG